jgi:hypothetical protein
MASLIKKYSYYDTTNNKLNLCNNHIMKIKLENIKLENEIEKYNDIELIKKIKILFEKKQKYKINITKKKLI